MVDKEIEINVSDEYNLNYVKIYELLSPNDANVVEINNTNNYNMTYEIESNGLYIIETKDVNGNINRKSLYVNDLVEEIPIINNVTYTENNVDFDIFIEVTSNVELNNVKYFLSDVEIEENAFDINNFIDTNDNSLNLKLNVNDCYNKYLYVCVYNSYGIQSNIYKIQLLANVYVIFKNENGEIIKEEDVPYNSSALDYVPTLEKEGYTLSWNDDITCNMTEDKEFMAIWTIHDDNAIFSIIIPKVLSLNENEEDEFSSCDYTIQFKGEMGNNVNISVSPDNSFYLKDTSNIKKPILVSVFQPITIIEKEDILFEEYKVINGTIKTKQKVTAGRWYGTFNFNISTNVKESNVS